MNWIEHLLGILLAGAIFAISWFAFESIWKGKQ